MPSRLLLALALLPGLAAAAPIAIESRVGDGRWARRAAVETRVSRST